jgi:2-keto-4-pentenoate hydratase/2-oxohepta-3-ene-1,7-dioic acid hydratase in catechol pathway
MRICRFDGGRLGLVDSDQLFDVSAVQSRLGNCAYPFPGWDLLVENLARLRPAIADAASNAAAVGLSNIRLETPVANPGKIVAAPVNYQKHLDEAIAEPQTFAASHVRRIQETGLFLKANSSLVGPSEGIALRFPERRNDHEIELVAVIGQHATNVSAENALDIVAGYAIGLDITVRGPEERSLRKSIDTYSVLGPWLVTADEVGDPSDLELELKVNGETRQKAHTRDLILSVPKLIEFASSYYTLHPGDLLFTGTPEGVGPVVPGDRIEASIDRIGSMEVDVRSA